MATSRFLTATSFWHAQLSFTDIISPHDGNTFTFSPLIPCPNPTPNTLNPGDQPLTEAPAFATCYKISRYAIIPRLVPNHKPIEVMRLC